MMNYYNQFSKKIMLIPRFMTIPRISILDRYLLKELAGPFFLAVFGFIIFMVSHILFLLTDVIINKNVPFNVVAKMMILRLPSIIVLTLPVATLFGTVLSISGMVASNEITALRSIGISFPRIMAPFLIVGISLSALTFVTNEKIVPWAMHQSENIVREMLYKQQTPLIQANIFQRGPNNQTFYVQMVDERNKSMENIMIFDQSEGNFPKIITAKKATWDNKHWYLLDGMVHKFDPEGKLTWTGSFTNLQLKVDIDPKNFFDQQKTAQEMTSAELEKQINQMKTNGEDTKQYEVDYHIKFSLPMASLITALVGAPLSVKAPRSGKMMGIAYSFGVVFVYYNLMSIGRSFSRNGILSPILGAWCPVIVVGLIGLILILNVEYTIDITLLRNILEYIKSGIVKMLIKIKIFKMKKKEYISEKNTVNKENNPVTEENGPIISQT